jgi:hypothetical protein
MELKKTDCLRAGQALKKMYPSYHYNWPEHGYLLRNDEFLSSAGGWRKISAQLIDGWDREDQRQNQEYAYPLSERSTDGPEYPCDLV